jgi:hypothetical protein
MVTKMLHASGLFLGDESDLIPSNPNNPEGFWENKRFVRINSRVLDQLRGAWDCPPAIPEDWVGDGLAPYRAEAEVLLADFADREPWGWKDPRNCLTLPFWQSILRPIPVVIVVRNPLEVAKSLRERNGFSYALGLTLWQDYNQRLIESVAECDRIVTHYDACLQNPESELRRLMSFVGFSVDEATIEQVADVHRPELRHHRSTTQEFDAANVAPDIIDLYRGLCAEAHWVDIGQQPHATPRNRDAQAAEEEDLRSWGDPSETQTARRTARKDRSSRRRQLEEAEARIAELERTVEEQRLALAQFAKVDR